MRSKLLKSLRTNKENGVCTNQESQSPPLSTSNSIAKNLCDFDRVSEWFDADGNRIFKVIVRSGDILELRNRTGSHFGIALRIPVSQKEIGKKHDDELMVYHLIHSSQFRGQVGQFTLEDFWSSDSKIRINNTSNGWSLYCNAETNAKTEVLNKALMAYLSSTLKWQTCSEFIRWSCEKPIIDNE